MTIGLGVFQTLYDPIVNRARGDGSLHFDTGSMLSLTIRKIFVIFVLRKLQMKFMFYYTVQCILVSDNHYLNMRRIYK